MTPQSSQPQTVLESVRRDFPDIDTNGFRETSPATADYNCIAWAAGEDDRWWQPADPAWGFFWPTDPPAESRLAFDTLVAAYVAIGFIICDDAEPEDGCENVALYRSGMRWTHAARRLADGTWTSKLGSQIDIRHAKPECLCGATYGEVACFMKRPKSDPTPSNDPTSDAPAIPPTSVNAIPTSNASLAEVSPATEPNQN